jgi:hypothetical protein
MKYSSRFFLYAPFGVFLLLLAVAGIHWWIAASRLGDWLDAKNGREIMPGVTLGFSARHITGFPFSLDTEMHDVSVAVATGKGELRWQSEKFAMHALAYGRDETIFEAAGHQVLRWDASGRLNFAVGVLRASAIRSKGALDRFDLDIVGFGSAAFTAQRLQLHLRRAKTLDTLTVLDGAPCPGLAEKFELRGAITQADAFSRLATGEEGLAAALTRWRGKHGAFKTSPPLPADMNEIPVEALIPLAPRMLCRG